MLSLLFLGAGYSGPVETTTRAHRQVLFEQTFFPALTAIDSSRPVWAACPASAWSSGVDPKTGLPDGTPFEIAGTPEPPFPETHSYWFSMCSTMENCRNCVDDSFYRDTSFASEFGWIGMPSFESLSPVLPNASQYTMHSPAMVDRQNRITPILTTENTVKWNFDAKAAPYIDRADPDAFKRVIHMSQVAQTDCVRAESEHYHRGRDSVYKTAGATFWMLNDNCGLVGCHPTCRFGILCPDCADAKRAAFAADCSCAHRVMVCDGV